MTETTTDAPEVAEAAASNGSSEGETPTDDGLFHYTVSVNGGTHTLTFQPLNKIPTGILRHARGDPEAQLWGPFEWALSFDDLEVLDQVPLDELPKIQEAWSKFSEVELGELLGSSSSSTTPSTGKRSKRI